MDHSVFRYLFYLEIEAYMLLRLECITLRKIEEFSH